MDNFKTFYNEKNGKYILFFGFYLIFFIFVGFYMKSLDTNPPVVEPEPEKITSFDISNLINEDYEYNIEIYDNDDVIDFSGTKSNIDYANFDNKYFLDIYNINQLLKRSRLISSENYILTYELNNTEINDILLTEKKEGVNKIEVSVNVKTEVNKIMIDLSNYLEKDKYQIIINYIVGDKDENSSS